MQSIRFRLAVYYCLALIVTIVAFATAVYWERTTVAPRRAMVQLDGRLDKVASFATNLLIQQSRALPSATGNAHAVIDNARLYFDAMPEYVFVTDDAGHVIYASPAGHSLPVRAAAAVSGLLVRRPLPVGSGELERDSSDVPLRYHLASVDSVRHLGGVLVAAPLQVESQALQEILASMALLAPLILGASAVLGYWLAGRALDPLETMIEELEAVQDGRTLHRRLAVPAGQDELSRLATKLNAMLARVEQSFVALRRFTADASHELKTPLMVLRAGVERSLTHPQTPHDIVATLDETLRQINQMSELVTNLLTLARADEGRAGLTIADADLRALVAEAAETAEILGAERGVTVKFDLPPEPVIAPVDAARVRQLLMNLVTNAVKYTPPGGEATLKLVNAPDVVTVSVQDTGIGIAPGDLPNVFERFWQADLARSRTGEHPGTGLGLAISKWIAEAHGGSISAQSRPGRGSTFTVTFPRPASEVESVSEVATDR